MLVTQGALFRTVCCAASVFVIFNLFCLSLVSEPSQPGIKLSLHRILRDWGNLNHPSPDANTNLSLHFVDTQQQKLPYVEAPLDRFFSSPSPNRRDYHEWNEKTLRDLYTCMALEICGSNQMKVALLADKWMTDAVIGDFRGGEGIWALSIYKNLRELGYTILFSNDFSETLHQYRMMPDLVKVIIRSGTGSCHQDVNCVKSGQNPSGIPAWKLFEWSYWPDYRTNDNNYLMKGKWLLSATPDRAFDDFDLSPIQYIGYSTQDACNKIPVVPLHRRKNQVWMLMKQLIYVYHNRFPWNRTYFPIVHEMLGVDFVGGWLLEKDYLGWNKDIDEEILDIEDHAHGVFNLGMQPSEDFYDQVRNSKVMIGMTNPHWSPSPIDALCLGVPFLNPISSWNVDDPWNKSYWDTQHPTLVEYDQPYVYHVHAKNFTGFLEAIESATKTPIDRRVSVFSMPMQPSQQINSFIPEHMTEVAVKGRLVKLMETDWKTEAQQMLRKNMKAVERGEDAYIYEL